MTTTPHAAAAATARQRLASVLATLQQNPNVPPSVLEILSGLARAMGPLFQLERGSPDTQLFLTARGVLQETLEKIQTADQRFPGVAEATGAVAETLGTIFNAMRAAGLVPQAQGPAPMAPVQPAAQPGIQPAMAYGATQMAPAVVMPNAVAPLAPQPMRAPTPAPPQAQPQYQPQPQFAPQATAQPIPLQPPQQPIPLQQNARPAGKPQTSPLRAPTPAPGRAAAPQAVAAASVPIGPNGVPRLESEIGVHSETNFYTDFLGDISNHGGIFVATFHVLPIATQCEVLLTFPGNLTAQVRGAVRWKRENAPGTSSTSSPGLGIEILQADATAWDLIHRFIRKREPIMHEM